MTAVSGEVSAARPLREDDVVPDEDGTRYFTIDELSAVSAVPSRTIRYYQSKGVLPHPERRGRVAVYTDDHLDRLRSITSLQDRGLRLDAIRDVFEQVSDGAPSLQEWLGLDDALTVPWLDEEPLRLTRADLLDRLGPGRDALLEEMLSSGLVLPAQAVQGQQGEGAEDRAPSAEVDRFVVLSPGLLDISLGLDREQIDYRVQIGALEIMRTSLRAACDELVQFFAERAGAGFAEDTDAMARQLAALRPLGGDAVRIVFGQEMQRSLEAFVASGGAEEIERRQAQGEKDGDAGAPGDAAS